MKAIENLLRQRIGLDPACLGSSLLLRIIRSRMRKLGIATVRAYESLLEHSPAEWTELVEQVVVSETWFFRDREAFAALGGLAVRQWKPRAAGQVLRLLSLPCSSGEEPYSVAMTLLDAGFNGHEFKIDAVDISARALGLARRAVYGRNSFRGDALEFQSRYFENSDDHFTLDPAVRQTVSFYQGNPIQQDFPPGTACYDFIFCRNLLIYFDGPARALVIERLKRLLAPRGVLFVGPAELPLVVQHGFVSEDISMAFACRDAGAHPALSEASRATSPAIDGALEHDAHAALPHRSPMASAKAAGDCSLHKARRLADAGRLAEAVRICQAHLETEGPSAQVFYLLGLLSDAAGGNGTEYYRKSLYLDPGHYLALVQMATTALKRGDLSSARSFQHRAERAKTAASAP